MKKVTEILERALTPTLMVLVSIISILFREFDAPDCTKAVEGPLGTRFIFNCDSAQFMQDSQDPSRLFNANTSYQDRPLYSLLAYALSRLVGLFIKGERDFINSEGTSIGFQYANLVSYLLIHIFLFAIALFLLHKVLNEMFGLSLTTKFAIYVTLFLHDVVKGFFWTPHTQVFSVFMTIFALYSWQRFIRTSLSSRFIVFWFLSVGILIFFYPIQVLLLVIPVATNWKRYLFPSVCTLLPYLLYPMILRSLGGTYRNPQVEDFNQFVWVFSINSVSDLTGNALNYVESFSMTHVVVLAVLCLIYFILARRLPLSSSDRPILLFILAYFVFLFLMGLYAFRLPLPLLLLCIVVVVIFSSRTLSKIQMNLVSGSVLTFLVLIFFFTQGTLS